MKDRAQDEPVDRAVQLGTDVDEHGPRADRGFGVLDGDPLQPLSRPGQQCVDRHPRHGASSVGVASGFPPP